MKSNFTWFALSFSVLFIVISLIPFLFIALVAFPEKTELLDIGTQVFEIVKINPPKHYYLTLRNVVTNEIITSVYVSKHFNDWRELPVNTQVRLTYQKWKYSDDSIKTSFPEIFNELKKSLKENQNRVLERKELLKPLL